MNIDEKTEARLAQAATSLPDYPGWRPETISRDMDKLEERIGRGWVRVGKRAAAGLALLVLAGLAVAALF